MNLIVLYSIPEAYLAQCAIPSASAAHLCPSSDLKTVGPRGPGPAHTERPMLATAKERKYNNLNFIWKSLKHTLPSEFPRLLKSFPVLDEDYIYFNIFINRLFMCYIFSWYNVLR